MYEYFYYTSFLFFMHRLWSYFLSFRCPFFLSRWIRSMHHRCHWFYISPLVPYQNVILYQLSDRTSTSWKTWRFDYSMIHSCIDTTHDRQFLFLMINAWADFFIKNNIVASLMVESCFLTLKAKQASNVMSCLYCSIVQTTHINLAVIIDGSWKPTNRLTIYIT